MRTQAANGAASGAGRKQRAVDSSPERMSDLIGAIYDCALTPAKWAPLLDEVRQEFSFANAMMGVLRIPDGRQIVQASIGVEPEWLARVADFGPDIIASWGGPERINQYPLDEPVIQSQAIGREALRKNRYVSEWAAPQGLYDAIALAVARDASIVGNVAFGRHHSGGEIGEREVAGLRHLGPHFRRAVTIGNLFDMKAVEASTFESVLEALAFGVLLVDERLSIVHANGVAEAMLSARQPIQSQKGELVLASQASNTALLDVVSRIASDEAAVGQRGIGVPAGSVNGEPSVIHVLPLRRREIRPGLTPRAVAALFVTPATTIPRMPMDALTLLYDLTPAEVRVFELICSGLTPVEIAAALGTARSTVKSHLLHVFQKTGCSRQVDLVKLAAGLSWPV